MNPYRDPTQQAISVAMSPRPGSLGGPSQQMPGQPQQQQPPPGLPTGMGRGASNTGLQSSALALNNFGPGVSQQMIQGEGPDLKNFVILNTYIYDHLLRHGFYKAARGLYQETFVATKDDQDNQPNQDNDGNPHLPRRAVNLKRSQSGMDDHPHSSPNDKLNGKSPGSSSTSPNMGHEDLPAAKVPLESPDGFLRDWWVVFWDIYAARSGEESTSFAQAYLDNQRNQHRVPQFPGQLPPGMQPRPQMMNGVADDHMDKKTLMQTAMLNNGRKVTRPGQQPVQMQQNQQQNQNQFMRQQQQAQLQNQHQQQQQMMQREEDPASSSPAMGQRNSPNKRPRLSPPQNDYPIPTQIPTQGPPPNATNASQVLQAFQNPIHAKKFLASNNRDLPAHATPQELSQSARTLYAQLQQANAIPANPANLQAYKQKLSQQQSQQGRAMGGSASPAGQQATIPGFPNPGIPGGNGFSGRGTPEETTRPPSQAELERMKKLAEGYGGQLMHPANGSHSLHDYQTQLMVLEEQNKKRLQHARNETIPNRPDDANGPSMNGQFVGAGGGLQPGNPQMQGVNMSPQSSRTGPSPQMSSLELVGGRKPGQKTASGGASPEPGDPQIRGPSPAFAGPGAMSEHYQQMMMNPQYAMMGQNGAGAQFMPGRQHAGVPFGQGPHQMTPEMMKMTQRMQPGQQGQGFQQWQMANAQPPPNQMRMLPQQGPSVQPTTAAQMPPPPQPQVQNGRPAPNESPSIANAPTPTPTTGNKAPPKTKAAKEGGRAKRNRNSKSTAAPATPNASEPPTPTTPITPHAVPPFGQHPSQQQQAPQPQSQAQSQPDQQQQPSQQDPAPPSAFASIDRAPDPATESWPGGADDKWMTNLPLEFSSNFNGALSDFGNSSFAPMAMEDEIVNYGEFLNDTDGMGMDFSNWAETDLTGTEA